MQPWVHSPLGPPWTLFVQPPRGESNRPPSSQSLEQLEPGPAAYRLGALGTPLHLAKLPPRSPGRLQGGVRAGEVRAPLGGQGGPSRLSPGAGRKVAGRGNHAGLEVQRMDSWQEETLESRGGTSTFYGVGLSSRQRAEGATESFKQGGM